MLSKRGRIDCVGLFHCFNELGRVQYNNIKLIIH